MRRSKRYWAVVLMLVVSIAMTAMYSSNSLPAIFPKGQGIGLYLVDLDSSLRFSQAEAQQSQRKEVVAIKPIIVDPKPDSQHLNKENGAHLPNQTAKNIKLNPKPTLQKNVDKQGQSKSKTLPKADKKENKKKLSNVKKSDIKLNYTIANKEICVRNTPVMLICIHTATTNSHKREAIRQTWGNATRFLPAKVVVVFVLAATKDSNVQSKLLAEQKKHGDLIQDGGFIDAYRNLTYKSQSMLRWAGTYCPHIKLLFKVDDDSFLIPARVSKWLQEIEKSNSWPTHSVIGTIWINHGTDRKGKWKTPKEDWPDDVYTKRGCPGSGYMLTGDAIPDLVNAISKVRFLWLEDLYVTGVLSGEAGLSYVSNADHHKLHFRRNEMDYYKEHLSRDVFLFGHMPSVDDIYNFWSKVKDYSF